jgi:hypothetical protein
MQQAGRQHCIEMKIEFGVNGVVYDRHQYQASPTDQ